MNILKVITLTFTIIFTSVSTTQAQEVVGQASTETGTISVNGTHARKIEKNGPIYEGDTIESVSQQTVVLQMKDGSELWVSPETHLTVEQYVVSPTSRNAKINLNLGSVRALIEKREGSPNFIIKTHAAVMGVRGTEFFTETDSTQKTSLYTLDGAVAMGKTVQDISNPQTSRLVERGNTSVSTAAQTIPTSPVKYDHDALISKLQKISPRIAKSVHENHLRRLKKLNGVLEKRKEQENTNLEHRGHLPKLKSHGRR